MVALYEASLEASADSEAAGGGGGGGVADEHPSGAPAPRSAPRCGNCVCVSFLDLSVWCHACESYIEDAEVTEKILVPLREAKFPDGKVVLPTSAPATSHHED
jgi:hypothetical protein